ncbi:similar to Saccharomyces cerevisiae YML058W SML1 Ribonucleotide reductase inhibitor involved in regulating dNTP production [Maudiozyma saulgeensis]|uniref:Similar to Saccharomyces cerevisiae YML058W SML1 Ribonucleotide reductase inhibitor involved in regulating dNTP production n=1 Tax=Maudiozyma saulgeensis TaxID=1789683 RepID=A0A1X7QZB0_9SACH|nr:similar to Saccharomyces cerevisiae YML058W SML1 Ribonucleotide reductase inhibitor involved in regulating dNTP production [Kazachstania saulgeensis]
MNDEQKTQYLKELNETSERVREHVRQEQASKSPEVTQSSDFKRVPMPSMGVPPPMLAKNSNVGSSSTLEMWDENVNQKLNEIDNKMNKSDLSVFFTKGEMEF